MDHSVEHCSGESHGPQTAPRATLHGYQSLLCIYVLIFQAYGCKLKVNFPIQRSMKVNLPSLGLGTTL